MRTTISFQIFLLLLLFVFTLITNVEGKRQKSNRNRKASSLIGKLKNVRFSYDPSKVRRSQQQQQDAAHSHHHRRGHRQHYFRLNRDAPPSQHLPQQQLLERDSPDPLPLAPNPYSRPEESQPEVQPAEAAPVIVYTQPATTEPPPPPESPTTSSIKIYKFRLLDAVTTPSEPAPQPSPYNPPAPSPAPYTPPPPPPTSAPYTPPPPPPAPYTPPSPQPPQPSYPTPPPPVPQTYPPPPATSPPAAPPAPAYPQRTSYPSSRPFDQGEVFPKVITQSIAEFASTIDKDGKAEG